LQQRRIPLKLLLLLAVVFNPFGGDGFGAFKRQAKSAVPEQLAEATEGTGNTEQDGVVILLYEIVVVQEHTTVRVNVGVGVLGLAMLGEHSRHDFVDGAYNLEELVFGQVLQGELALAGITGVGFAEHGVAVARNHLAGIQSVPGELSDGFGIYILAFSGKLSLEILDPAKNLPQQPC
jgi:hypothetical protein